MPDDSSVEKVKRQLYARGAVSHERPRRALHEAEHSDLEHGWASEEALTAEADAYRTGEYLSHELGADRPETRGTVPDVLLTPAQAQAVKKHRLMARFIKVTLISSIVFFVGAAALAAFLWYQERYVVSCEKLSLEVETPISVPSGKELSLSIVLVNNNPVAMNDTNLIIDYPEGTRSAENTSVSLPSERVLVGELKPSEQVRKSARAVLFGKENDTKSITARAEYRVEDSNADFVCEVTKDVKIATAPVTVTVDGLEEISSGQELELTVTVRSNSEETVPDLRLVAEYPFGYKFKNATPQPTEAQNVWDIGDLAPGGERTFVVRGTVQGQTTESRALRFMVGEKHQSSARELAATVSSVEHALLIARPFLSLDLVLNGNTGSDVPVTLGDTVQGELSFENTLPSSVYDVEIEAAIPGPLVDQRSVRVPNGFYKSVDRTMIWTPQTNSSLRTVEPGAKGTLSFSFKTNTLSDDTAAKNPSMTISFNVRARRVSETSEVPQQLVSQAQRTVKFISSLGFEPSAVYGIGPFTNTGPHPPRVDQETTYTIVWNVTNSTNDVDNVRVQAELPLYVSWRSTLSPADAPVSYNPVTRQVLWTVGDVPAGTGVEMPAREVAFQISVIPSITQLGGTIDLVLDPTIDGVDRFTGSVLQRTLPSQTTRLTGDPYFPNTRGDVAQ